jgi:SAM-dependent methyltransferase
MKSRWIKSLVHHTLGELSVLNGLRLRIMAGSRLRPKRADGRLWVHLGCGNNYAEGMLNVDINPFVRSDLWLNLKRSMPFRTGSVDAIYCNHVLEHFYERDVRKIVRECLRILRPGGGIRLATPDLKRSIDAYVRGDVGFFSEFPDKRRSLGGRMANHLLCRDQHCLIFDFGFWKEILEEEGWAGIRECSPHQSELFPRQELAVWEYEQPEKHQSVFVEASKPGSTGDLGTGAAA